MIEIGIKDASLGAAQAVAREAVGKGVLAHSGAGETGLTIDQPQRLPCRVAAPDITVERLPSANGRRPGEGLGGCSWGRLWCAGSLWAAR